MAQLALELPDEVFSSRRQSPRLFLRELRLAAAIHWYARGEVSMEKAALIADLDRNDFLEALAVQKVDVFSVDLESLQSELNHA